MTILKWQFQLQNPLWNLVLCLVLKWFSSKNFLFRTWLSASKHDYLDAERGSCLMNTHWNTVSSNGDHRALSLYFQIPRVQVWSSNPSQNHFFRFFSFSQFSATVNQWRIFFEQLYRSMDMSCHWSHITKDCLDWDSNPRPGNVEFAVELELAQHAIEEKRESALCCLLFHAVFQAVFIWQLPLCSSREWCPEVCVHCSKGYL